MDAITILKNDHDEVEKLFQSYERLGDRASDGRTKKKKIVAQVVRLLSLHSAAEEQIFYPMSRKKFAKVGAPSGGLKRNARMTDEEVLQALEEHHLMKISLWELDRMNPSDERYDAKMAVLTENVRQHVEEEESRLFVDARKAFSRQELNDMGVLIERAKKIAPTRPHPRAPDSPPANILASMPAGVLDRARDAGKALLSKVTGTTHRASSRGNSHARSQKKTDSKRATIASKVTGSKRANHAHQGAHR